MNAQVFPYAMAYACLKSVNYALFFWIPFYLTMSLKMDNTTASLVSVRLNCSIIRWIAIAHLNCCRCCMTSVRSSADLLADTCRTRWAFALLL